MTTIENNGTCSIEILIVADAYAEQRRKMNACRFTGHDKGHYESCFLRANHTGRLLVFWIRYTIFAPKGNPSVLKSSGAAWRFCWGQSPKRRKMKV